MNDVYIKKLVTNLLANYSVKDDNFIFIKHYNDLSIPRLEIEDMLSEQEDVYLLYHEFEQNQVHEAYEPFLLWISDIYYNLYSNKMTVEEFIENCNVYSLQKSVFISYIKNGKCTRSDEVLISEISFEKMKFYNSMLNIYSFIIRNNKVLLVLNNIHYADYSTIALIFKILNSNELKNMGILGTYNESFTTPDYMSEVWNKFIDYINAKNYSNDWAGIDNKSNFTKDENLVFKSEKLDEYILKLNNMLHTFAVEQAEYYAESIYQRLEFENLYAPIKEKRNILKLYAMINIYLGAYNKALVACENLKSLYKKNEEILEHFICEYIMGMAFVYMAQYNSAKKSAKECMNVAKKLNDDYYIFKAEVLSYMIQYYGWNDIIVHNLKFEANPEFLEKLEYYGYKNVLAHMYVYGVDKNKPKLQDSPSEYEALYTPEYLKRGMDLGYELGNDSILIVAYMNNIEFFRGLNNFKFIEQIYKECIKILAKNNDKVQIASMYNGIGYNSSIVEKYVQANKYYEEALDIFYNTDNVEFMGETLYNMSLNCIQARDYKKGLEFALASIHIADDLEIMGYRICKNIKLYGMVALCYYYLESDYNCYIYFSKMENVVQYLLDDLDNQDILDYWSGELVLYFLIAGLLAKQNEEYIEAKDYFQKALKIAILTDSFKVYIYPLIILELARLFKALQKNDVAKKILLEGIEYCNQNGYYDRQNMLVDELNNKASLHKTIDFELKNLTIEDILEKSRDFAVERQLKNRLNDINFMSQWQDRLDKETNSIEEVVNNSMKTLQNNFSLDYVYYFKADKGKLHLIYSDNDSILSEKDIDNIKKFFDKNTSAFFTDRTEKDYQEYEELISIFKDNQVFTIVGVPIMDNDKIDSVFIGLLVMHRNVYANKKILNHNNFIVLKYVFGQFVDALERMKAHSDIEKMNFQLEEMASTDLLTGLLNRQGFMSTINESVLDIASTNVIMYIDLDNFKYYNDTVGHEIGDFVLVLFANILKECAKDNGYAIRYGGDEFLLLFLNKDDTYAAEVAKKIYSQIEDGFEGKIGVKLKKNVVIPDEKKLSCCIGIAQFNSNSYEAIEEALDHADEALYAVKNTTKGNYKVWKDE